MNVTASSFADGGGPDGLGKELLTAHHRYRRMHSAPSLQWSEEAARTASQWASRLARLGRLEHDSSSGMGQNLFYKSAFGTSVAVSGEEVAKSWYDEVSKYDFNNPGFSAGTGHFTQVSCSYTHDVQHG